MMGLRVVQLYQKLLETIRQQQCSFLRLADGEKLITNPILYEQCEEESYRLQKLIGRENKRRLSKKTLSKPECQGRSLCPTRET